MPTIPRSKNLLCAISFVSCASLVACASAPRRPIEPATSTVPPEVSDLRARIAAEFGRHRIHPVGEPRSFTDTLPVDLMATASWGTKVGPCAAGGYELALAAGHAVSLLRYDIDATARGERLYAWVVVDGPHIACVFRSVREDSEMAPGVFPASGD